MLRWGTDIYSVAVGLNNIAQGIVFLPICVPLITSELLQKNKSVLNPVANTGQNMILQTI